MENTFSPGDIVEVNRILAGVASGYGKPLTHWSRHIYRGSRQWFHAVLFEVEVIEGTFKGCTFNVSPESVRATKSV